MDPFDFNPQELPFKDSLSANTSTGVLCKRLETLHKQLASLEQGTVQKDSLKNAKNDLLKLINHKDKFTKILVSCCLADVLKLYAPDPPFNNNQLKSIFTLFFKQLHYLKDANNDFFSYYFYLLDSLSTYKSVLLLENCNADQLVLDIFVDFLDIIKPEMTLTVQVSLRDILQQLLDEFSHIPPSVIEVLMGKFSKKSQINSPGAFKIVCDLGTLLDDKLQRYVCQYFSDVMIASSRDLSDDSTLEEFKESHSLILEIFEHCPTLLLNVVPQLEEELKVEHNTIRHVACTTLGVMFSKKGSIWVNTYPHVWKSWCERRNDKHHAIRCTWVESTAAILMNDPSLSSNLEELLCAKLMDPDEKVRSAVIKSMGTVALHNYDIFSQKSLQEFSQRCRDKKMAPRMEAIEYLAKLFHKVYNLSIKDGDEVHMDKFIWIPGNLLELLYLDDSETTVMVEKCLHSYLVTTDTDHEQRTLRLIRIIKAFNERQRNAFLSIMSRQAGTMTAMEAFIQQCEKFNGGVVKEDEKEISSHLDLIIKHLCSKFTEPKKHETQFLKFASLNDRRVYKLIRGLMDPSNDFKTVLKYHKEIITRLGKQTSILEVLQIFLRRISFIMFNRDGIEVLIELVKRGRRSKSEDEKEVGETAESLVKDISKYFPGLYKTQMENFRQIIVNEEDEGLVIDAVEALSKFVKAFPDKCPSDPETLARLVQLAKSENPKITKHSAVVLATSSDQSYCEQLFQFVVEQLSGDFATLTSQLSVIVSIAKFSYEVYQKHDKDIMAYILNEILMKNERMAEEKDNEWVEYEELENEGKCKVIGLKILMKPLLLPSEDPNVDFAKAFMKLARSILQSDGELVADASTSPMFKTHLRLNAGLSCLKLQSLGCYTDAFEPLDFIRMSLLIQDPVYHVRERFIDRVCSLLVTQKLPLKYSMWLVLAAHEPEISLQKKVKEFLIRTRKHQRSVSLTDKQDLIEHYYSSFAYLLANHPDFSMDKDDLKLFETYINFFLDTISTSENISYLYHVSGQLKTIKDRFNENSVPIYIISEMTQLLIRERCANHNWILQTYPGKTGVPRDFFERLSSTESNLVIKTVYLEQTEFMADRISKTKTPIRKTVLTKRLSPNELTDSEGDELQSPVRKPKHKRVKGQDENTPLRRSSRARRQSTIREFYNEEDSN